MGTNHSRNDASVPAQAVYSTVDPVMRPARFPRIADILIVLISTSVNAYTVVHYLGPLAGLLYGTISLGLFGWLQARTYSHHVLNKVQFVVVVLAFASQLSALVLVSPSFDLNMDRDSAIVTWLEELIAFRYPYAQPTDIGNPISPLPAIPLIAAPFYLLGNVGYLQIAAYLLLVLLLHTTFHRIPLIRFYTIIMLSSSPLLFFEVVARSDLVANMTLIVGITWWLERHQSYVWKRDAYLLGILVGVTAATRLALLPAVMVIYLYMLRKLPSQTLFRISIAAGSTAALLLLPFLLWDTDTFLNYAPIGVSSTKLGDNQVNQMFWLSLTLLATTIGGLIAHTARHVYGAVAAVSALIMLGTWVTFFNDITYLQLVFIPILFALSRKTLS